MPWADLIYKHKISIFYIAAFASLFALATGFIIDVPYLGLIAFGFVGVLIALYDFKILFYLLLFVLPLSDEFEITPGFRMHLPTEALVIILLFLFIPFSIINFKHLKGRFWKHPLTVIIIVNITWIFITMISSTHPIISLKYLIAKLWFVGVYYFLASYIITSYQDFRKVFWLLVIPTLGGLTFVLIKHGMTGFLFDAVSAVVRPFYRNHVDYGVWITAMFPFLFLGRTWYKKDTLMRLFFNLAIIINGVAIYFSYTRGAWVALLTIPIFYLILKNKMIKPVLAVTTIAVIVITGSLLNKNQYLDFAPDFNKTIYHGDFSDHMTATFQMEDMSTVERFYRWIAAVKMFEEKPLAGFGPGNFVNNYKNYTVSAYETYISDNEEGSSVHNYFLTMLTEQGIPGLLIFVVMIFIILIYFEKVYHQIIDHKHKQLILTLACCFFVLLVNNLFSDLLEADKLGPLFFMCMAILVNWDLKSNRDKSLKELTSQ